jgi:hypothetical protein
MFVEIPVPRKCPQTKIESNINMFAEGLLHHNPEMYHHVPYVSILKCAFGRYKPPYYPLVI